MKSECWTAVRGASGRDFSKISPNLPSCPFSAGKGAWPGASGRLSVLLLVKLTNVNFVLLTCRKEQIMKSECWTAVRGASGRDFSKISPKPAPLSVLSWEGGVARAVRTVECTVVS